MKTLTRIEACQVLLDGGKLEYSQINSGYWSDVTNRELVFTLDGNYIFRETPEYEFIQYTLDELISKRPRFLVLSKTLEDNELKAIYGEDVKVLNNKPSEIKKFTVESQYDYTLSDEYFDTYKTFNSENEVRNYLAEEFNLFTGNYDLVGDFEE